MKCGHCQTDFHASQNSTYIEFYGDPRYPSRDYQGDRLSFYATTSVCSACAGAHVTLEYGPREIGGPRTAIQMYPRGGRFPAAPPEVPLPIASDYQEANEVLPISPKASAALARRCLQAILSAHGYRDKNLVKQVEAAIDESDASKALPISIRENIDAIRNFGNFSAHPITDQTTLQVVEVEEGEAEWCLELLIDLFEHYYVSPARAAERRAVLAAKLSGAGKPPMKQ